MTSLFPNGGVFKERISQVLPGGPAVAFLSGLGIRRVGSGTPSVAGDSDTAATRPTARTLFFAYRLQNVCTHEWRGCGHGQVLSPCVCSAPPAGATGTSAACRGSVAAPFTALPL